MIRYIVPFLLLLGNPIALLAQSPPEQSPNLVLKDLEGREQRLADYRGKIVVLNFWATWCAPCVKEMPLLVAAQQQYRPGGVQVIGASADDDTTKDQIPGFVQKLKINFPVWVGATTEHMQAFGLGAALPGTAFLDRDGKVVGRIIGVLEKDELEKRIEWLLGDRSTPAPAPVVNKMEKSAEAHEHEHAEEDHVHGGVGMEGASSVPS